MNNIIERTMEFVKDQLPLDTTGHDWHHAFRVWKIAKYIAVKDNLNINLTIVELAALLHDIADWKFNNEDLNKGSSIAFEFLTKNSLDKDSIIAVCTIIRDLSFKGANASVSPLTLEGKIVQDADRLDAMGAIGIARAFSYGGFKGQLLHDPALSPTLHKSFEEYKSTKGTTVNHFYEKLFTLKDRMHTKTGKSLADSRHAFLKKFMEQFLVEWKLDNLSSIVESTYL